MPRREQALTGGKAKPSSKPLTRKKAPPKPPKPVAKTIHHEVGMENGIQLGSQLWRLANHKGQGRLYNNPQELWDGCVEYFDWITANPLKESKLASYEGDHQIVEVPRLRAMTIRSLCVFLDIDQQSWANWRKGREDLQPVIAKVEDIIFANKFEGAAAGLLNPTIIARELGLIDKREQSGTVQVTISGEDAEL